MEARPAQCAFALGWLDRFGMSGTRANSFFDFLVAGPHGAWSSVALVVHGALLCVLEGERASAHRLGSFLARRRATFQTLIGPDEASEILTGYLCAPGREPRVVQRQWLMIKHRPSVHELAVDRFSGRFRHATMQDLPFVLEGTLAMHEEETGVANTDHDIEALIGSTFQKIQESRVWMLSEVDSSKVLFKASIALPTPIVAQIEGVWTAPNARGQGFAGACLRAMCIELFERCPALSLTVGMSNEPALRLYRALGFETVAPWRTVYIED